MTAATAAPTTSARAALIAAYTLAALNAASLLGGVIFVLAGSATPAWNAYGALMLATLVANLMMALSPRVPAPSAYRYLGASLAAMLAVPLLNMVAAAAAPSSRSALAILAVLALFALGLIQALAGPREPKASPSARIGRALRLALVAVLSLDLALGIFFAYILLDLPFRASFVASLVEVFIPEFGVFYGLSYLTAGALIARLLAPAGHRHRQLAFATSLVLAGIFMLPMAATPALVRSAERTMAAAFGDAFRTHPAFASPLFRQTPFSIPEYFYGTPAGGYTADYDVVFYRGQEGVDEGLVLRFDVYRPAGDPARLPGGGSTLIRIHGGAWSTGDKGGANWAEVNKYFARQGYVVFDIQYGLSARTAIATRTARTGEFTIDDMVRHIGIFTTYLAGHAWEHGADPGSVFISGGSAGGHLALAVGLGLANGRHSNLLDPRLTVKGLIPFYPANELAAETEIGGSAEWCDARAQIDAHAPPALIYQGTADSITPPVLARRVQQAYAAQGLSHIAIIDLPLATHGSDMYFPSYYNQAFLYYMERFMYQHR